MIRFVPGRSSSTIHISKSALGALVAAAALLALGVYVALGFLGGDTDRYGRVPVPGAESLELEAGDVDLFYAEDVSLGENESLAIPGDLEVRIAAPGGSPLEIRPRGGQQVSGGAAPRP